MAKSSGKVLLPSTKTRLPIFPPPCRAPSIVRGDFLKKDSVFNFNAKHQLRLICYGLLTSKLLKDKKLSIKLKSKNFTKINLILTRIILASIQGASCFCDICNHWQSFIWVFRVVKVHNTFELVRNGLISLFSFTLIFLITHHFFWLWYERNPRWSLKSPYMSRYSY